MTKLLTTVTGASLLTLCTGLISPSFAFVSPPTPAQTSCTGGTLVSVSSTAGDANRAAIQLALDNAAKTKGIVRLGSGTFSLSGSLKMATGVTLCSSAGAALKWAGPAGPSFAIDGGVSSSIRVANITFDGAGIVLAGGSNAIIEANVFRNIKPAGLTETQNVYGWTAIWLVDTASISIRKNVFIDLAAGGIAAWKLTGTSTARSVVSGNWFARMNQPIGMENAQYVSIESNEGYDIERMAVELVGTQLTGDPVKDHPGIVVSKNRFGNWKRFDTSACLGNTECEARYGLMGISVVSSTGAIVENNVLDCGSGCVSADRGWGIEFSSYGTARVNRNTVRGFTVGIQTHWGQTMTVEENALFDVRNGIHSDAAGSIDNLTVRANQIEASVSRPDRDGFWSAGISPQWDHTGKVLITDNTITYRTNPQLDQVGGEYVGIAVAAARSGGTPGEISLNRILIEGAPAPGFDIFGFRLGGTNGSLTGTLVNNNWVAALGNYASKQGTALDGGWQDNGTKGVILSNNVFQNLAHVNRFYNYHGTNGVYTTSNNWAINMDSSAAPVPNGPAPVLALAKTVALPTISIAATPLPLQLTTAPTTFKFVSNIASTPAGFSTARWHSGTGPIAGAVKSFSGIYSPGATRIVRALARDGNGAVISATKTIVQQ
jgi:hypothetical protein